MVDLDSDEARPRREWITFCHGTDAKGFRRACRSRIMEASRREGHPMDDGQRTFTISGGTFNRSMLANGDIHGAAISETRYTVEDLRSLLEERRAELIQASSRVEPRLTQLTEDLAEPDPDPETVRGGWKAIAKIVTGAGVAAESVKQITDLVQQLFGG
jgi:hypothetical protein